MTRPEGQERGQRKMWNRADEKSRYRTGAVCKTAAEADVLQRNVRPYFGISVSVHVCGPNELPRSTGKARRVVDWRPEASRPPIGESPLSLLVDSVPRWRLGDKSKLPPEMQGREAPSGRRDLTEFVMEGRFVAKTSRAVEPRG